MTLFVMEETTDEKKIIARIKQLRLGLLVHSVIYYELNKNIISDIDFDKRSKELQRLQNQYPGLSKKVPHFYKQFKDWDGGGGNHLPLKDEWAVAKAESLLVYEKEFKCGL